ncbi:MAG: adenine phosphoribosyltransferase [Erysipelotrichaceae bacterium]|nr:adenine phosphoribosyltransferase [Erysipelotrichaceae bacterium]
MDLNKYIAIRENWPKEGISFKDITPLTQDPAAFKEAVERMAEPFKGLGITKVLCADARGFIFGGPVALILGAGMSIARKPNKLPYVAYSESYDLEYGSNTLEVAPGAVIRGDKVLVVDDLLATGGSAIALTKLAERAGGEVVGYSVLVELTGLKARNKLKAPTHSLIQYEF